MKKHLIICGIVFVLLVVGLSGCSELVGNNEITGNSNIGEITSYNIMTEWKVSTGKDWAGVERFKQVETSGILKNQPSNSKLTSINIDGIVKNIAGEKLNIIRIRAKFYDKNGNYLDTISDDVRDIANSYTGGFSMSYRGKYLENCNGVKFEITNPLY